MNTIELNKVLADEIYKLRAGKAKPERSNAVVRAASTMISAARLELAFCRLVGVASPPALFSGRAAKQQIIKARPMKRLQRVRAA